MCGIAVAINWEGADGAVRSLIAGILHRGDVTDPLVAPLKNVAMCTRRLRIVDARQGVQPQASFDERLLVSLNGEIYNHAELRREMEQLGVPFRTESDTEVLANALQVWGAQALKRLVGMYAFVAIDVATGEFLAARDPFGVKPLYLIQSGKGFLFCSEIKPLLDTVAEGEVMLLPPGYLLTRNFCRQFYQLPQPAEPGMGSPEKLDAILAEAVRSRIPPDMKAAALFSGGIDSTLMMHYARRHQPDMPGYIIASRDAPDIRYARHYADMTGLDMREIPFEAQSAETLPLLETVAAVAEAFEPAIVRPALYGYLISRRIHQDGYRVALCGEGADELFAGYGPLEHVFAQSNALGRNVQEQCLSMMHRANLQRVDRCSMRFELEIREPFLDLALVEYACGLDASALLKRVDGLPRGFLLDPTSGTFRSDRASETPLTDAALRALAAVDGQDVTYTCAPPGEGRRLALDRDDDGVFDRDEIDHGSDPNNPRDPFLETPTPTVTVTPTVPPTATATKTPGVLPGDADCNDVLNTADPRAAAHAAFDRRAQAMCDADCTKDGKVTAADFTCIIQLLGAATPE